MKGPLVATLLAAALLLPSCSKKNDDDVAGSATPAEASPSTSRAESASPTNPQPNGVAELAITDSAYEAWFKKYNLDLNDPNMLDSDEDGDGFSNRYEFLSDTDPRNPESRPGVHANIRLQEYNEVRLPFILRAVEGESARIEREEGGKTKSETIRTGQPVRGTSYKVQRVESIQTQDKDGNPIDASKVTLEDTANASKIDLVKDLPTRSTASTATLVSLDGVTTISVHQGDVFQWPGDTKASYRVVDLRGDQVIVEQVENKKMWTIPKK